ncbi:MAG: metallophosphoesterase [Kofleriaceae bacterium]
MRATWLTDLHLNFVDEAGLKAFATAVMRERPDVIFVTGDTGEAVDVETFFDLIGLMAPTYGVLGNHDYYRSTIAEVRGRASKTTWWLPGRGPIRLTDATTLIGIDGWGDARCGNLDSAVRLADWKLIGELDRLLGCLPVQRCATLQALGTAEAEALRGQLAELAAPRELIVLTHVPPFADACWYDGARSSPEWLPWFTCIAVGDALLEYARAHPETQITVLCGHTHGRGEHRVAANLNVRTGGWAPHQKSYGNPIVQASWAVA